MTEPPTPERRAELQEIVRQHQHATTPHRFEPQCPYCTTGALLDALAEAERQRDESDAALVMLHDEGREGMVAGKWFYVVSIVAAARARLAARVPKGER